MPRSQCYFTRTSFWYAVPPEAAVVLTLVISSPEAEILYVRVSGYRESAMVHLPMTSSVTGTLPRVAWE